MAGFWTDFWNFLGTIFKLLFSIMPPIGAIVNILLIAAGFFACGVWIWIMLKDRTPERNP